VQYREGWIVSKDGAYGQRNAKAHRRHVAVCVKNAEIVHVRMPGKRGLHYVSIALHQLEKLTAVAV
jgi:hypothetical protein